MTELSADELEAVTDIKSAVHLIYKKLGDAEDIVADSEGKANGVLQEANDVLRQINELNVEKSVKNFAATKKDATEALTKLNNRSKELRESFQQEKEKVISEMKESRRISDLILVSCSLFAGAAGGIGILIFLKVTHGL